MTLPNPPTTGSALYRWASETEQRAGFSVVKYLESRGKRQGLPVRWSDWTEEQVTAAYADAAKKIPPPSAWKRLKKSLSAILGTRL